ncbi:MAG: hypothetical protein IKD76_07630 [Clostridia bacterium]|nr:hypothetical protein [Clostridia bacterium]
MQKVSKTNWGILLFSFFIEFAILIILLNSVNISIYNNIYKLIKVATVCLFVDEIYVLYLLDFSKNKKHNKSILKIYKEDVNWAIIKNFAIVEVIKCILIIVSEKNLQNTLNVTEIILLSIISCFIFYSLYFILPKSELLMIKIKRLKLGMESGKTTLKFILIDSDNIPSSFDFVEMSKNTVSRKHVYINLNTDFVRLVEENKKMKKYILDNTVALIHEVPDCDFDNILRVYKENEINNCQMYHVMAVQNYKETEIPNRVGYVNAIKLCDVNNAIEYVEKMLDVNLEQKVSTLKYIKTLKKIKLLERRIDSPSDQIMPKYIKKLNVIYKYNFNNKVNINLTEVPKEEFSFELYRNAILAQSPFEAVSKTIKYITFLGKLIEYYLFAKYNPRFTSTDVYAKVANDDPTSWSNNILLNISEHSNDALYNNIRVNEFELSKSEKVLLSCYLSKMLNVEIVGDTITFDGLMNLFIKFKNKVDTQRFINNTNIYCIWNAGMFFAEMLNKIFNISQLHSMFDVYSKEVTIGYGEEEKVKLGKYVAMNDGVMCLINQDNIYVDYFNEVTV